MVYYFTKDDFGSVMMHDETPIKEGKNWISNGNKKYGEVIYNAMYDDMTWVGNLLGITPDFIDLLQKNEIVTVELNVDIINREIV